METKYKTLKKAGYDKSGSTLVNILLIFIFVISLILIIAVGYLVYMDLPGSPENVNLELDNLSVVENESVSDVYQFYPNMKFNHNDISYRIEDGCEIIKKERMISAFNELSKQVNIISFHEVSEEPDIEVSCTKKEKSFENKDYFIAGEGGAKEIVQTGAYNVITGGVILLYESQKKSIKCDYPNVEMHELMHVFGFNHSTNKNNLMYPYLESCNQVLDDSLIKELKRLYSQENLPDLYFEDAKVIKKGRYLDFNLTVKNSGDVDAPNVSFSVFDESDLVETRKIGDIKYGAGIVVEIKNFKLIRRNPTEVSFVIDAENKIKESDNKNNIVKAKFD